MADITLVHDCDIERLDSPVQTDGPFRDCWIDGRPGNQDDAHDSPGLKIGVVQGSGKGGDHASGHGLFWYDLKTFLPADVAHGDIVSAVLHYYIHEIDRPDTSPNTMEFVIWRLKKNGVDPDNGGTEPEWTEAATWNDYDGANPWTGAGALGDIAAPTISLGDITSTGWNSDTITAMVTDALQNRDGVCTFLMCRGGADPNLYYEGWVILRAENYRDYGGAGAGVAYPHHLTITYTLADRTFQVIIR